MKQGWLIPPLLLLSLAPALFAQHGQHSGSSTAESPEMKMDMSQDMRGLLGRYPVAREGSGTSWQPDSTKMGGAHFMLGGWSAMVHGNIDIIYDWQGGPRGDRELFSSNMLMLMAQKAVGSGSAGFRSMFSLEPATIGNDGYPLLFQTGETADGKTPLIDRQHPHDLFMELAAIYSLPVAERSSAFIYGALPGEPALGPPVYVHRYSGMNIPDAPLLHHWLDSTHITFGVVTLGYILQNIKLDASVFRGREPDENRWDIETGPLDSCSARFSVNPGRDWALQASYGFLKSPEQLEPEEDLQRYTFSAIYNRRFSENNWQTLFTVGRNRSHEQDLDGFLLESTLTLDETHSFFARVESVEKDELLLNLTPPVEEVFQVSKAEAGYIYDFSSTGNIIWGIGGSFSIHLIPDELKQYYGDIPIGAMLFTRVRL